ncbi:coiled-coil domain-containing protein 24-like isoform X2 [Dendronephthya gigantea]|uniref:coiled-coil domain-containing protein 24-like isoform X2 n=1 Tax=Dendronephthya gigantea TaxID=151771 RepID=UPI00106C766A|nr:coiled-coil domain-containing protein 24-like isoform X2 [Dendronephthya gigantea]
MSSCSGFQCSSEAFEPRQSLWKLVEEYLPLEEQREIKEILGEDIIDETADLHREVLVLLEIWEDYRNESENSSKDIFLNPHCQRLPEPPEMRENLKKEIQLFVTALKQRSVENESNKALTLSRREKSIVEYAFTKSASCLPRRPKTAVCSDSGRSTPCRPSSSGSGSRSSSSLSDVMESFQEQLNVQDVDQLADRLRNILKEEKNLLLEDIAFLQNSLFEESHFVDNLQSQSKDEPTLQELKELGIKLEKEMTIKGTPTSSIRNSYSSPPRRPARPRNIVRSSSSPNNMLGKPSSHDNKPSVRSPPHSEDDRVSHAPLSHVALKRSQSEACSPPAAAVSRGSDSSFSPPSAMVKKSGYKSLSPSPPTSAKRNGHESLSPSPPASAVVRKPGSMFRKVVLNARHDES